MSSKAIFSSPYAETTVALNAVDQFLNTSNKLYFMVGRGSFVIDGLDPAKEWTIDTNPPAPGNTPNEITELWDELLYGREIPKTGINLVMPSIQGNVDILLPWADRSSGSPERNFDPYDPSTPFTFGFTENRFYINSSNEVFMNLEIAGGTASGDAAGGEPDTVGMTVDNSYFNDGTTSIVTKGTDVWKYLYTIHNDLSLIPIAGPTENNFWVPVNYGTNTNVDDAPDLPYIIGTRNITVQVSLPANFDEIEFRQNWIVINPTGASLQGGDAQNDKSVFDLYSGDVLYIENRPPQIKQSNQEERVLLAFNY